MSDDPPFLPLGTEVSSKFKGAYCESTIIKIEKKIRVKFSLKEHPFGIRQIDDPPISISQMAVGKIVTIPIDRKLVRAQVLLVKDKTNYFVVFNDGDKTQLRRTQIVPKGDRHFSSEGNLDAMPLNKPEDFSAPVKRGDRGSKHNANEPSTSRRVAEENREAKTEEARKVQTPHRGKGKRRAAENARSAIGDMSGVINDTLSEESADDQQASAPSSNSKSNKSRKRREEEWPEPDPMEYDEPSYVNGAGPSTSADARDVQVAAKEKKKKKKKDKEKKRQSTSNNSVNDERPKKEEQPEEEEEEEPLDEQERKKVERMFRECLESCLRRNRNMMRQVLYRKSTRYSLRYRNKRVLISKKHTVPNVSSSQPSTSKSNRDGVRSSRTKTKTSTKKYPSKTFSFESRYRIRNALLFLKWRNASKRIKTKKPCRYFRQWKRFPIKTIRAMLRNKKLVEKITRKSYIKRLFVGVEQERWIQFIVFHDNIIQSRRLLKFVDVAAEADLTFADRLELTEEDVGCRTVNSHFNNEKWAPAIVLPKMFSVVNAEFPERVVRNVQTGKLIRMWEDDLVPIEWLPSLSMSNATGVVKHRKAENQSKFLLAFKFTMNYCCNKLHRPSLKAMLKCRRRTPTREFTPLKQRLQAKIAKLPPPVQRSEPGEIEPLEEEPEEEDRKRLKEENRKERKQKQKEDKKVVAREEEKDPDTDYDSDHSIKNAPVDKKDAFIAQLFQFHDARNTILNTSPQIEGHDVELYYMHELAIKIGGPRKIHAANPWTSWANKLVPNVKDPEEQLKEIFKTSLEGYILFNLKYAGGAVMQPRTERKQMQPGIYSENRKKRQKALEQAGAVAAADPSTSQATPKGRGSDRKRKAEASESGSDRKRNSRNATMSPYLSEDTDAPGPSNAMYSDTEDDNQSQKDDERAKRKKSKTPGNNKRRSVSEKDDSVPAAFQPPKKGRPKKNASAVKSPPVPSKSAGGDKPPVDKSDESEFVRANLLSFIAPQDTLRAWYDGTWYKAHCVETSADVTGDIQKLLMKLPRDGVVKRIRRKTSMGNELKKIFDRLKAKAHYTGWNGRFDETLSYDYLKVLKTSQVEARKRFATLPNGKKLRPALLALVERALCQEDEAVDKPDYLQLAEDVLGNESDFESDEEEKEVTEKERKKRKKKRRRIAQEIRASLMETSTDEEEEELPVNAKKSKKVKKNDVAVVDRRSVSPSSRQQVDSDDHSPELGERSTTPSSKSSTSILSSPGKSVAARDISSSPGTSQSGLSPEPANKLDEYEEGSDASKEDLNDSAERVSTGMSGELESNKSQRVIPDDHSPELGVQSSSSSERSMTASPQRKSGSPEINHEGELVFDDPTTASPDNASRLPSKVTSKESSEEPENIGESTEAAETASSKSTIKGAESDAEEPEYPTVPRTPEPAALPSPKDSSGNQNYPSLNRQGSTTAAPIFSPTTNLAHSGPLTLEEVPVVVATSSYTHDRKGDDGSDIETLGKRRRTSAGIESTPSKRMRRASERSAGGTDESVTSPKRQPPPLAPQPVSGALTLQMAMPESSGPIEPLNTPTSNRRKTASPTFNSTGPLVLSPTPQVTSTGKPPRPPGAPPLGRPKKNSAGSAASSRKTEERDELRLSIDKVVSPSAVALNTERTSGESSSAAENKEEVMVLNNQVEPSSGSPRGGFGGRGGKRKRGGRAGAVAATKGTPGRVAASRKNTLDESEEKEADVPVAVALASPVPIAPPCFSRPDTFANQKARMAKFMEENGTSQDFHLINIDFEKVLRESPPEDININLEEMSNEARDIYLSARSDLLALEKLYRKIEAAKKKEAEAEAEAGNAGPSSSSDEPSTSSTPNNQ